MSFIIGANSAVAGGFSIDNSCRLDNPRDGASSPDYLTRTPSGATNQKTLLFLSGLKDGDYKLAVPNNKLLDNKHQIILDVCFVIQQVT